MPQVGHRCPVTRAYAQGPSPSCVCVPYPRGSGARTLATPKTPASPAAATNNSARAAQPRCRSRECLNTGNPQQERVNANGEIGAKRLRVARLILPGSLIGVNERRRAGPAGVSWPRGSRSCLPQAPRLRRNGVPRARVDRRVIECLDSDNPIQRARPRRILMAIDSSGQVLFKRDFARVV
jgi:hypothetical protein